MTAAVALWTAGGPGIGIGHLSRCRSLAFALRDAGARVGIVADAPASALALFEWDGLLVQRATEVDAARPEHWWPFAGDGGARVIVSDRPNVRPAHVAAWRAHGVQTIAHLCDDGADQLPVDLFINGDAAPPTLEVLAPVVRVGPAWHIVRPEVVQHRGAPSSHAPVGRVLVSLGAADPGGCSGIFAAALAQGGPLPFDVTLVVRDDVVGTVPALPRLRITPPTPDLPGLLFAHDLVVTFPGLTAYEAACIGRPVALIEWSYLAPYAAAMAAAGMAVTLGGAPEAATRLRTVVRDVDHLHALAVRAHAAIDGRGAERVAALILAHAVGQRASLLSLHPSS